MKQALLGALALLFVVVGYQDWKLERVYFGHAEEIQDLKSANDTNQEAIEDCKRTAAENIRAANIKKALSEAAAVRNEKRVKELERDLAAAYESRSSVANRVQGDCPAAADPEFVGFLCSGPLGCDDP